MTHEGKAGRAFRAELLPPDDRSTEDAVACLARWNLWLPGQHPLWSRYTLGVVHLRDAKSLTPAKKQFPEATHEILVFAVDPDFDEALFADGATSVLEPLNHVVQFVAASDQKAVLVAEKMVQRLVDGLELAEPSGISGARELFKKSVQEAASAT
jgi:hypothetical protein